MTSPRKLSTCRRSSRCPLSKCPLGTCSEDISNLSAQIEYMQEKFEMSSEQVPSDIDESVAGEHNSEDAAEEVDESSSEHADGRRQLSGISPTLQRLLKH